MHKRPGEKRNNWLLIKSDDQAARGKRDKDILDEQPLSVKTGRTMDEIADGVKVSKKRTSAKKKTPAKSKKKAKAFARKGCGAREEGEGRRNGRRQ